MKIHKNKRKYIIPLIIVVLIASSLAVYFSLAHQASKLTEKKDSSRERGNQDTSYSPPSQQEINAGKEQKNETVTNHDKNSDLTANFSAINKTSSNLQIRILVEGIVTGTCELVMQKGTLKVEKSAAIQPLASSSTCQGFDIPLDSLSPGSWRATITINSEAKSKVLTRDVDV